MIGLVKIQHSEHKLVVKMHLHSIDLAIKSRAERVVSPFPCIMFLLRDRHIRSLHRPNQPLSISMLLSCGSSQADTDPVKGSDLLRTPGWLVPGRVEL